MSFCLRLEADSERAASLLQLAPKCSPYSATARSTISTRRQALVLAKGRHWALVTRSPCLHLLVLLWAWIFVERRTYLTYIGSSTLRSTNTVMVLFILSLTTRPVRVRIGFCCSVISLTLPSSRSGRSCCARCCAAPRGSNAPWGVDPRPAACAD